MIRLKQFVLLLTLFSVSYKHFIFQVLSRAWLPCILGQDPNQGFGSLTLLTNGFWVQLAHSQAQAQLAGSS